MMIYVVVEKNNRKPKSDDCIFSDHLSPEKGLPCLLKIGCI